MPIYPLTCNSCEEISFFNLAVVDHYTVDLLLKNLFRSKILCLAGFGKLSYCKMSHVLHLLVFFKRNCEDPFTKVIKGKAKSLCFLRHQTGRGHAGKRVDFQCIVFHGDGIKHKIHPGIALDGDGSAGFFCMLLHPFGDF